MVERTRAYVGLGSNLGDRSRYIAGAVDMLGRVPELRLLRVSEVIETAPLGGDDQQPYLNAVAEVLTELDARALLKTLAEIETLLGRRRDRKWAPRTIDLDLLLFGDAILHAPGLTVPHPQMHLRSFALRGLVELDAGLVHPVLGETVEVLAARLNGCDFALDATRPQLVCIAGVIGVGKTTLAERLAARLACPVLREPYDTNPFMPAVYAGKRELALDSQLYFLVGRVEQLDRKTLAPGGLILADYVFDKELIYARRLLDAEQLALYQPIHVSLAKDVVHPVLVLYLCDRPARCLERIRKRNRPYEQKIDARFLDDLSGDYRQLFDRWRRCPVIRICSSDLDYRNDDDVERLARQVRYYTACDQETADPVSANRANGFAWRRTDRLGRAQPKT